MFSEQTRNILTKINNYLPGWAEFTVKQYNSIYQANIIIDSNYFKTFNITTESTCLDTALLQILKMLEIYWVYKEDEHPEFNKMLEDLKMEKIID